MGMNMGDRSIEDFQVNFPRMRNGYLELKEKSAELSQRQAPAFNIFKLLRAERNEVQTHSVLLAELLDPKGSHGQGDLFLRNFLDFCQNKFTDFPNPERGINDHWSVHTEWVSQFGRIDLAIINPDLGLLVVIENKIDALEQPAQLERYWQWLETRRAIYPYQAVVYLTVKGSPATTCDHPYYRLSYHIDISQWLVACIPEIQASGVKEIVLQYLDIIRNL
jgi:hypothetical protein